MQRLAAMKKELETLQEAVKFSSVRDFLGLCKARLTFTVTKPSDEFAELSLLEKGEALAEALQRVLAFKAATCVFATNGTVGAFIIFTLISFFLICISKISEIKILKLFNLC